MKDKELEVNNDASLYIDYKPIIEKLNAAYHSYIKTKQMITDGGQGVVLVAGSALLASVLGTGAVGVSIITGTALCIGFCGKLYKKELLNAFFRDELGDTKEIEKYYKQLPKALREKWIDDNIFAKLAKHLKETFPDEDINFDSQELEDFNLKIDDDWVLVTGHN